MLVILACFDLTHLTMGASLSSQKRLDDFSNYLRKKGMKITHQRILVAQKIFATQSHFTADHLAEALKERRNEISRATIYRIIAVMVEAGLLAEHDFGHNAKVYEQLHEHEHHDHIICVDCSHIEEFCDPNIERIQEELASKRGFILTHHSLNLYASCRRLKEKSHCPNMNKKLAWSKSKQRAS